MKSLLLFHDSISLPRLVLSREEGVLSSSSFENHFIRQQTAHLALLTNRPTISTQISPTQLTSLDLSGNRRFLLSANESGAIFLYDLSKWGLDARPVMDDHHFRQPRYHGSAHSTLSSPSSTCYSPIGQAQQGKSVVRRAQWHGSDAVIFVTASADGRVVVWDATALEPVLTMVPFPKRSLQSNVMAVARMRGQDSDQQQQQQQQWPISCMDKNRHSPDQIIVTSAHDACVKLVDLRSATCSHSLLGHSRGCNVARWSPHSPYNVASGDGEGNIFIWDVRRVNSCMCVLQREEAKSRSGKSRGVRPYYGHLKRPAAKNKEPTPLAAPSHASHAGPIEQLAFDANGQYLVSLSNKTLTLWDMLDRNPFVPRQYAAMTASNHTRPILITPNGRSDYIIWVGDKRLIKGYSLLNGGNPIQTLKGHLGNVTDIISNGTELMSTARDQIILQWGQEHATRKRKEPILDQDNW